MDIKPSLYYQILGFCKDFFDRKTAGALSAEQLRKKAAVPYTGPGNPKNVGCHPAGRKIPGRENIPTSQKYVPAAV